MLERRPRLPKTISNSGFAASAVGLLTTAAIDITERTNAGHYQLRHSVSFKEAVRATNTEADKYTFYGSLVILGLSQLPLLYQKIKNSRSNRS